MRADESELRRIADPTDASAAIWSSDGQRLTFRLRDRTLREVAADRFTAREVDVETGAWRGLLPIHSPRQNVSLSRDGRTLLVEQESVDGDFWMLEIPDGGQ